MLGDQAEIDNNLQLGKKHLQAGQLSEALFYYSAAVGKYLNPLEKYKVMYFIPVEVN